MIEEVSYETAAGEISYLNAQDYVLNSISCIRCLTTINLRRHPSGTLDMSRHTDAVHLIELGRVHILHERCTRP